MLATNKKNCTTKKIDLRVDNEMYDSVIRLAAKKHMTNSALIRRLISMGLEKELAAESVDFVRDQIHEEIRASCYPQFNRLAKLIAKIGYQSCSNFYLLAYIMDSILPAASRTKFDEIKRDSKAMAIAYLKLNEQEFAEFMKSEDAALEMLGLR